MSNLPTATQPGALQLAPRNMQEAMQFADMLARSTMVPKDYINKPGNVLIAMQWGHELGIPPLQAIQNIAVINGRPAIWGDLALALVSGSGLLEDIAEDQTDDAATCTVIRKGRKPATRTFTVADAKAAGLWKKSGPWTQYPKRMMQMRARAFALRDVFPDVLKGIHLAEEQRDVLIAENRAADMPYAPDEPLQLNAAPEKDPIETANKVLNAHLKDELEQPWQAPSEELLAQIAEAAASLNPPLIGKEFGGWLKNGYKTTWSRMSDETARLVLADLQDMAADGDDTAADYAEADAAEVTA